MSLPSHKRFSTLWIIVFLTSTMVASDATGQEKTPSPVSSPPPAADPAKKEDAPVTPAPTVGKMPAKGPPAITPSKDVAAPVKPEGAEPAAAEKTTPPKPKVDDDLLLEPGKAPAKPSGDDLLQLPALGPSSTQPVLGQGLAVPVPKPAISTSVATTSNAAEEHAKLLVEGKFPSASTCATCHPTQFGQWSVSQHAYAQLSPVFNSMQATIDRRTGGTNGDFCIRCHTQVGMQLKESVFMSNMDRHPTSREGITCIVCHRVKSDYGKVSGRTAISEGDIFEPMYGPKGNAILKGVLANPDEYQVVTKRGEVGRAIHTDVVKFDPLEKSNFCGTCHDVNLLIGFRLEEAFSQFKNSPANKRGETCQDCHMGKTPGIKSGYEFGPAAKIGDKTTPPRKLTNHTFAGPDYSIIHPGLFPFNVKAQEFAKMREWLQFNYAVGWGTDAFEKKLPPGYVFPPRWQAIDDRYDARALLDGQLALLEQVSNQRYQLLRRGFQLGELAVERNDAGGIQFKVRVVNGTDGHGAPTGFDAERADFLQVSVTDRTGKVIFQSGDRDPNGDVRDAHSRFVHNWEIPVDKYLFKLQSKFIVRLLRGGEREQIIPTNLSMDPLPYVRPPTNAAILLGRSDVARKQALVLPPHGDRWAPYEVDKKQLTGKLPYKVNIKFITQMVPVNLVGDIEDVGFDYNMSAKKIADTIVARSQTLWDKTIVLPSKPATISLKPSESEILAPPYRPFIPELATAKVVAKVEPAKKQETVEPEKANATDKKSDDLLDTPEKKAPEEKKEMNEPGKKNEPENKATDLLNAPEKKVPEEPKEITTPEKKYPVEKKAGDLPQTPK